MPSKGGSKPLRACGARFVAHKVAAIGRLLHRYGAYLGHLTTITKDTSVRAVDQQKLKGYVLKWRDCKMVLGSALFYDILNPAGALCKALQQDEICVVGAIECMLKTSKAMESLLSTPFDDLPTVKKVLGQLRLDEGEHTYQGVTLTKFEQGVRFLWANKNKLVDKVVACLKDRVKSQHSTLLSHILALLATQGWEKPENADLADVALDSLTSCFEVPLERAGVDTSVIKEEWGDMNDYAKRYLNLAQESYLTIWWKLFNAHLVLPNGVMLNRVAFLPSSD